MGWREWDPKTFFKPQYSLQTDAKDDCTEVVIIFVVDYSDFHFSLIHPHKVNFRSTTIQESRQTSCFQVLPKCINNIQLKLLDLLISPRL